MARRKTTRLPFCFIVLAVLLTGGLKSRLAFGDERPATVLLITDESLAEAWQCFSDWKTRCGKPTKIVTVQSIDNEYDGEDMQAKIRDCVQRHVAYHGTRWVVLGGDSAPDGGGRVPDRDTPHPRYGYHDIPTDLYYISPTDWDADEDGIYGEWKDDAESICYTGVACIGRIPLRTPDDVKAYTDKVIAYESRYPTDAFAENFLYICTMAAANYKSDMVWDNRLGPAWDTGQCSRFFCDSTPWDEETPGDYDLTPDHWVEQLNRGAFSKLHMHGHGILPRWAMEGRSSIDASTVRQLENDGAYPIITTVSCFTGHYDAEQDPCIAETMLRAPDRGAIVMCAPSRPGVPIFHGGGGDPHDGETQDGTTRTFTSFWVFGLEQGLTTGEAWAAAKADMAEDAKKERGFHWCQCELNLLGDPTLDMRPTTAFDLEVIAPDTISAGEQRIRVQTGRAGMTVCLWKGQEVYVIATADDDGVAVLDAAPETAGDLLITVYSANANVWTGAIRVD